MPAVTRSLKSLAQKALGAGHLEITRAGNVPRFDLLFRNLKRYALEPKAVFDIGVDAGTPELYEAFPAAEFSLFDPSPASLPHMRRICSAIGGRYFNVALGDVEGSASLSVNPENTGGSTLIAAVDAPEHHTVPVKRFDSLLTSVARPSLMKIDAQGFEMKILAGMGSLLDQIDVYIIETATFSFHPERATFDQLHSFMRGCGFCLHEIVGLLRRPLDGMLCHIDAVYVKEQSPLRSDCRWG
jgi:FkbM family methyltransferase